MHEQSIGIEVGGRYFNIPTVYGGVKIPVEQAVQLFKQGKLRPLGQYSTQVQADQEAVKRSELFGHSHDNQISDGGSNSANLLDAIITGAKHTYGQVRDDISSLAKGEVNPGTMGRLGEVLSGLPLEGLVARVGQSPMVAGIMAKGGRYFHGTPKAFEEFDPALSKSNGLVGPGTAYLTNTPAVAADYAAGATHGMGMAPTVTEAVGRGLTPNIRPYLVSAHNALVADQPFPQEDMNRLIGSLQSSLGTQTAGSFQKGGAANRAQNVINSVRGQVGQQGQQVWDTLNSMMGPDRTNEILRNAGFKSIQYPGGVVTGSELKHTAVNVLDPSIMKNLFDALTNGMEK